MISYPSAEANHVLILLNPKAGRTSPEQRAKRLREILADTGYAVELSSDLAGVCQQAGELHALNRLRALIGVGGDGTAAELVNRTPHGTPITLLPCGTANLISKEFKLSADPQKIANMLRIAARVTLDAGRVRIPKKNAGPSAGEPLGGPVCDLSPEGRLFLVVVSAGIDAGIVRRVHARREENYRDGKKIGAHIGYHSYIKPIFQEIFSYPYPKMSIEIQGGAPHTGGQLPPAGGSRSETAKWSFVFNIPQYGFGSAPVIHCQMSDRKLDYCFFRRGWFWPSILNVLLAQMGGLHRFFPNARLGTGETFRLTSDYPIPFEMDGDPAGFLPIEIETVPNRITLVVPDKIARRLAASESKNAASSNAGETACAAELTIRRNSNEP